MTVCRRIAVLLVVFFLPGSLVYANVAPAASREEVQKKLQMFFAHLDEKSPAALSGIAKSPKTLEEIDKRIASMTDADVADFQKMMNEVPDWQTAPQSIAKMLSPEAMKTIQKTSAEFTKNAPQAEKARRDIGTLATVLKMLPAEKLKELGITPEMVGSLEGAMGQLSPLQTGILEQQLSKDSGWQAKSDAALAALPPALQKGAAALAKHGPLTALDQVELEKFRSYVQDLLARVDALPQVTKTELKIGDLGPEIAVFRKASPDVMFMLREQTSPEALQQLADSVALMERVSNLSAEERKTLESFRGGLEGIANQDPSGQTRKKVESLSDADLMLLKDKISDFDTWKERSSAYVATMSDPGFVQRLKAAQQPNPDPAVVASLETFRAQEIQTIDSIASTSPAVAKTARDNVATAPLPKLEFLRSMTANALSPQAHLHIAANFKASDCDFTILDFSSICQAIIDTINAISSAAASAVETTLKGITDLLQKGLDAVTNTVNTIIDGLVSTVNTIVSTATDIFNFVKTIPSLAWQAIKTAFNAILDLPLPGTNGLTIRALISGHISQVVPALQNALNLTEGFWNSLNDSLPQIPCPQAGFSTPFGTVGSADTVTKYNRYAFFLDKIFGLIPSDVFSLEVKIPAQVLYAAWQYLGLCLQDAANATASAQADQQFNTITTALTNLSNQANANTLTLIATINGDFNSLTSLDNTNTASLTTLITNKVIDLTNLIKSKSDDAKALALRMSIEVDLQSGPPNGLVMFELPQANGGYLELVRDTVNSDINAVLASGQSVGQAQKFFADGLASMASGKFKDAFKSFQKAYSELTKP